jgi:hypothetical protein
LPEPPFRSRGIRCSRVLRPPIPREAMASSLPFRPWSSLDPRAFGPEAVWRLESSTPNSLSCTSTPPQRLLPLRPVSLPTSHADHEPPSRGIRSRTLALQRIQIGSPLLARSLLGARPVGVTVPTGGPVLRVWLPSRRRLASRPLEAFLSLQRSWASPFRAFFPSRDRAGVSSGSVRSCAFLRDFTASYRRFSGLLPPDELYPLLHPDGLGRGGATCSPELRWPLRRSLR